MATDIYLACQLQELDQRIAGLTNEIDALPKQVAAIQGRLARHKQALNAKKESLAENAKGQRLLEGEVSDYSQRISKLQVQLNDAKTNEQFHAFQHEIQYCKDEITNREDLILDRMVQAEVLEEQVGQAEADLRVESAKVAADIEQARQRIQANHNELVIQRAAREELKARIDPQVAEVYEHILKYHGTVVTAIVHETCSSCHVRLRPKFLQDLRMLTEGVLTCENCGLIVYLPESIEGAIP